MTGDSGGTHGREDQGSAHSLRQLVGEALPGPAVGSSTIAGVCRGHTRRSLHSGKGHGLAVWNWQWHLSPSCTTAPSRTLPTRPCGPPHPLPHAMPSAARVTVHPELGRILTSPHCILGVRTIPKGRSVHLEAPLTQEKPSTLSRHGSMDRSLLLSSGAWAPLEGGPALVMVWALSTEVRPMEAGSASIRTGDRKRH